jgi:hypothetical protein
MRIAPVQAVLLAAIAVGVSLVAGVPGTVRVLGQDVAGGRQIGTMSGSSRSTTRCTTPA